MASPGRRACRRAPRVTLTAVLTLGTVPGLGRAIIAWTSTAAAVAGTLLLAVPIVRLHTPSPLDRTGSAIAQDALPRLAYLRGALRDGAGEDMQQLFPEGYFFTSVLYGLTWIDVGVRSPGHRDQALREARWAAARLDSPAGLAPFDATANPPRGVFHAGWSTWLRGGIVRLAGADARADERRELAARAGALADAFSASRTPFLAAYPQQSWPVDSVVAIAALRLTDRALGQHRHDAVVQRWRTLARQRLDPRTGLLPHRTDPATGAPLEGARASSQSVLLRFLHDVDPAWAVGQYRTFRAEFTSGVLGIPGVREYPRGVDAGGDVDSGPLILGMSASASAVALGDAVVFGDRGWARQLTGLAEATGMAMEAGGERRYLGGALPVGDAFLAWSLAARPWISPPHQARGSEGPWRWPWYAATAAVLVPLWALVICMHRSVRRRQANAPVAPVVSVAAQPRSTT